MATKFYILNFDPVYSPATLRGAWDATGAVVTKMMDIEKQVSGTFSNVSAVESVATADYDVLLLRGITGPLAAQTFGGTMDVMLSVVESATDADYVYHLHLYVTLGDTDTPRGTVLADYVETTGNEWGTGLTTGGRALASAQSLSPVVATAGDRLVVEIGFRSKNTHTTARSGTLHYGGNAASSDLVANGNGTNTVGYLSFSNTITMQSVIAQTSQVLAEGAVAQTSAQPANVSQTLLEYAIAGYDPATPPARVSQSLVEVAFIDTTPSIGRRRSQVVLFSLMN